MLAFLFPNRKKEAAAEAAPATRAKRTSDTALGPAQDKQAKLAPPRFAAPLSLLSSEQRQLPVASKTPVKPAERLTFATPARPLRPEAMLSPAAADNLVVFSPLDRPPHVHERVLREIRNAHKLKHLVVASRSASSSESVPQAQPAVSLPPVQPTAVASALLLSPRSPHPLSQGVSENSPLKMIDAMAQVASAVKSTAKAPPAYDYVRRGFTPEEDAALSDAWDQSGDDDDDNTALRENRLAVVTRYSVRTLKDGGWVNDEVVNFEMSELQEACVPGEALYFSSFFYAFLTSPAYDYQMVQRWTKKVDVFAFKRIVVPVHLVNHWVLAVVNLAERRFEYYDSLDRPQGAVLRNLARWLADESKDKRKGAKVVDKCSEWPMLDTPEAVPKQANVVDCGVFAMRYAGTVALGLPANFTQSDIPVIRRRLVLKILGVK